MRRILTKNTRWFFSDVRKRIMEERKSRLNEDSSSLPVNSTSKLSAFRNICTIAHIDAGKTTLTERLLFGCGAIDSLGEVHDGTALMDFMDEERKRGITINSACITFMWKKVHVNLIDTPGHADFNFEVERSLKILDGALVIIDAVKGVEAQTKMVWTQANKYNVSKIVVINKMDKQGAEYLKSIQNVEESLKIKVFPAFFPVFIKDEFIGIISILGNQYYSWTDYPTNIETSQVKASIEKSDKFYSVDLLLDDFPKEIHRQYFESLENIVECLSEKDERIAEEYLNSIQQNGTKIAQSFIEKIDFQIKKLMIDFPDKYSISLPTSALKNKGIHCALDAIIRYLPPPIDILPDNHNPLLFVFKRILDNQVGILAFAKVITGKISKNMSLLNINNNLETKLGKIYRIRAGEYVEMDEATSGDIIALSGFKQFFAGDNLLLPSSQKQLEGFLVKGFEVKESVFNVSLDFQSGHDKEAFLKIIDSYLHEDPSISFKFDKETGQYIMSGQGELHIETKLTRIFREHGIKISQGRVNVVLKEMVNTIKTDEHIFQRKIKNATKFLRLDLKIEPIPFFDCEPFIESSIKVDIFGTHKLANDLYSEYSQILEESRQIQSQKNAEKEELGISLEEQQKKKKKNNSKLVVDSRMTRLGFIHNPISAKVVKSDYKFSEDVIDNLYDLNSMSFDFLHEIEQTFKELLVKGPITCSPLINSKITILGGRYNSNYIDSMVIKMAVNEAYTHLVNRESCCLLEPMVEVQIVSKNDSVNDIISNAISKRKGKMGNIISSDLNETEFTVNIPLLSSVNYSTYLRSITNGEVKFVIKNNGYAKVLPERQEFIIKNYQ